ncbi:MAG TPA: hypothetical protein VH853_03965 [Polyangia bacterium]|nr:hypothetical protein [Polyangia bacterium]
MRGPRAGLVLWLAGTALGPAARAADPAPEPAPESASSTTIAMVPARSSLELGVDQEVTISVDLTGPDAERFVPLRALATVGTLEPLRAVAPGHFTARYLPPPDRFPEVALLLVELGNGAARLHCTTRIALEGSTLFPFHTGGGASVTMRVGDRQFGPVVADHQGHVEIPIDVPPGVRKAAARAVDNTGASRETEVDLQLPAFPRLLLLAPASLEVGSFTEITVCALDEDGAPAAADRLTLAASEGLAHPLGGPPGEARFLFEAPVHLGSGAVTLAAMTVGAAPARTELPVPLHAGPPHRLVLTATNKVLVVGDARAVSVSISARDRFGNPVSAADVFVRVDGRPTPAAVSPAGVATLSVTPPARYDGRESVVVDATLGEVAGTQSLHITGGPPVRLTLQVAAPRVVGDGKHGTELRVQAVDGNGTPTSVSGLSWDTPDGRIREVRVPRDGEYLAEYVPERTRDRHPETVTVMASATLRADVTFEVTPPPVRLVAGARTGLFTNFGETTGPAAFVEGLAPVRAPLVHLLVGFSAGYLRGDVTTAGVNQNGTARLETNQFPLLAVARAGISLPRGLAVAAEADAGWSWGWVRVTSSPSGSTLVDTAIVSAPALGGGGHLSYSLKPGFLTVGARYLWIALGRTSAGDQIDGNSAGLVADLGYNMTF